MNAKDGFVKTMDYLKNTKSKSVQNAMASLKDLRSQIKMMEDRAYPQNQIYKIKQAAIESIKLDLIEANKQELNTLHNQMEQLKQYYHAEYQKNYATHSRELEAYKRRVSAMSKRELEKEAGRYLNGEFPKDVDANIIDELSIALKNNNYDGFDTLREVMVKNKYSEPWLKMDVGEYLDKSIEARKGNFGNIVSETDDGLPFALSLGSLDDFLDTEEKEAENE
jgi:hypothetical protein